MKKAKIVFVPAGGLANRMKAVSAAVGLAADSGSDLRILWFKDWGLGCSFAELFQPINRPGVSLKEASLTDKIVFDRPRRHNLWLPKPFLWLLFDLRIDEKTATRLCRDGFDFTKTTGGGRIWMSSHIYFTAKQMPEGCFSMFKPTPELQQRIDDATANFGSRVVGIHVRRTDLTRSIEHSPTSLFIERMRREPQDTVFYLATDDDSVKKDLQKAFPERIIMSSKKAERGTTDGIKDALVELYTLSRTRLIIGSYGSSFSLVAAHIGGKTLEVIDKDNHKQ